MGSAQLAAIAVESPLLKASTYCSTASTGFGELGTMGISFHVAPLARLVVGDVFVAREAGHV